MRTSFLSLVEAIPVDSGRSYEHHPVTSAGGTVAYDLSVESNFRVILNPSNDLDLGTTYTVNVLANTFKNNDDDFYTSPICL